MVDIPNEILWWDGQTIWRFGREDPPVSAAAPLPVEVPTAAPPPEPAPAPPAPSPGSILGQLDEARRQYREAMERGEGNPLFKSPLEIGRYEGVIFHGNPSVIGNQPPPPETREPADPGFPGAYPLPDADWEPIYGMSDADWADTNRRMNTLLMRDSLTLPDRPG